MRLHGGLLGGRQRLLGSFPGRAVLAPAGGLRQLRSQVPQLPVLGVSLGSSLPQLPPQRIVLLAQHVQLLGSRARLRLLAGTRPMNAHIDSPSWDSLCST